MLGWRYGMTLARSARLLAMASIALAAYPTAGTAATAAKDTSPARYDVQDARLNAIYKTLSQSLDDAGRKALREEERQWITGRDQTCGVPKGAVVKNECTTTQTSFRADELEKRVSVAGRVNHTTDQGAASIGGEWGYRSDCNLGHTAELGMSVHGSSAEGTWSDGTRVSGSQGRFKGDWRDGKLYLRFCEEDASQGGYPACPAYSDVQAYVVSEGPRLAWYRADGPSGEGRFSKYVTLDRVPKGGKPPLDAQCKDAR